MYLGLALSVGAWTFTNGIFQFLPVERLVPVATMSYAAALFIATFFLLFNREFTRNKVIPFRLVLWCGVVGAILAMIPGVLAQSVTPSRVIITTPGIILFALLVGAYFLTGLVILFRNYRSSKGEARIRAQIILFGMTTAITAGLVFNFLLPVVANNYGYVSIGPDFTILYLAAVGYSIVKHHLFNLRRIVARSVAYILLLVSLAVMYGAVIFAISSIFFDNNSARLTENITYLILSLVVALSFQPLRRFFEHITDSIFYRDRYDSQVVLNNFSGILVSELDLDRILKRTITDICHKLHIQFGQVVVFNHERVYRIEHYGPLPKRLMVVPELRELNHPVIVADELEDGERKQLLDEHEIRVSLMLRTREEFIGYLLLGDKLSGDIYSGQDLELLEIIVKQMAVAILNAKAYAEIQEFNQTLQARVDHATSRLRVANRHLKELDKAKDEFISMASHQLRTPLTTIKGYLSMMLEGDAGRMTKTQAEFAGYAFGSSERMVNLISDLLNVSRLSAGRFIIQTKPTDMVDMIRDEVRQLETHASAKNLKLIFEAPDKPLPLAEIDDNKTRQVVMNFIDNAIYYTPSGSVTVTLDQTGQYVRLRVTDTGIGVPEEAKKKLFSKFFRADNAQSVRPDGTGLGLYLARRVVEDQGGTILFSSTLGKGSTFGFELPLRSATVKQKEGIGVS